METTNKTLKPFDKVLVRQLINDPWEAAILSLPCERINSSAKANGIWYRFCIPYEGYEDFLGTKKDFQPNGENNLRCENDKPKIKKPQGRCHKWRVTGKDVYTLKKSTFVFYAEAHSIIAVEIYNARQIANTLETESFKTDWFSLERAKDEEKVNYTPEYSK